MYLASTLVDDLHSAYHRYVIKAFEIKIPGEKVESIYKGNINAMSIEKDYENDHFPILYVNVNLPQSTMLNYQFRLPTEFVRMKKLRTWRLCAMMQVILAEEKVSFYISRLRRENGESIQIHLQ